MRWPRRGILIRLAIYVPLIAFLAWRAQGGCERSGGETKDDELEKKLAPHRKVITLPDGTQQEVVELTQEEAEQILGHPIPRDLDEMGEKKGSSSSAASDAKAGGDVKAEGASTAATATSDAKASADAKAGEAEKSADARPAEPRP